MISPQTRDPLIADKVPDNASPQHARAGDGLWRREDARFITGAGRYLADLPVPRMLHAAFVRSTEAHASILSIDVSEIINRPEVAAVLDATALKRHARPIRAPYNVPSFRESDYPVIADGVVRFVGEPIVLVVAESVEAAEEAASQVLVEYSPLPVVDHIETLLDRPDGEEGDPKGADAPPIWRMDEHREFGKLDSVISEFSISVEDTFRTQRLAASPLECRGVLVDCDRGTNRYTLTLGSQVPQTVRYGLAECLGIDEDQIRIIVPDMGGGFGNKTSLDPEVIAVTVASRLTGRPVRWLEERSENMMASTHGQEERIWLRLWADQDGNFQALEADIVVDGGAYSCFPDTPCNEAMNCGMSMVGAYRIEHYNFRSRVAVTNTVPNGAYRGVARPQANFALERLVDDMARRLGVDPLELRRRNMVRPSDMPYRTVTGLERDSGDYVSGLDTAFEAVRDWLAMQPEADPTRYRIGVGVACFAEEAAWGTKTRIPKGNYSIPGYDGARVSMDARGRVIVYTSAISSGQGHETAFAHLAADYLGVPVSTVTVRQGDTDLVPYGHGSTGSRSAVSTGGAVIKACESLQQRLFEMAARELAVDKEAADFRIVDGIISSDSDPTKKITVRDLAWIAYRREEPADRSQDPGLDAIAFYDPPDHGISAYSVHAVAVSVDVHTGKVSILKYVIVEDAGRLLHPVIVDGQVRGGAAQGIGKAMYEDLQYDQFGQPLTVGFASYLLPTAVEIPDIDVIHMSTLSPLTKGGIKGCGESGVIGPPAALGNAISNAFGGAVRPNQIPYTPERVWRWIRDSSTPAQ